MIGKLSKASAYLLVAGLVANSGALGASDARAQDLQAIQAQIDALQATVKELQKQVAEAKAEAAAARAAAAQRSVVVTTAAAERGTVNDAIYGLNFCFLGGRPPPAPYPDCGPCTPLDVITGCETPPQVCNPAGAGGF